MPTYAIPTDPEPRNVDVELLVSAARHISPNTFQQQTQLNDGNLYRLVLSFPPLWRSSQKSAWTTWFSNMLLNDGDFNYDITDFVPGPAPGSTSFKLESPQQQAWSIDINFHFHFEVRALQNGT